ncbi:phosphoribosylanthranilate isomerase [Palleronia aestuarii]|uniref:N-(5'-phosphoribosyl)anthranilate isomerase n=1 Tax=Palleronia aestuarii TaxID=568105 RepID=A0A2W7ND03_9RHOB|nr:phosphoribosylanthranilate isomerase [Palleronia aestuarii]PZX18255.1 phosphoribosylanthranilate isomerase [Palleronia aestuarii]
MNGIRVKICGLTETSDIPAALMAGAAYLGFVFFDRSPRNLALEAASFMAGSVPPGPCKVALTVDADDAFLDRLLDRVPLDMLQLHGSETPERVADIRARFGLPVMKALGIAGESDLAALEEYGRAADQILVDAKPNPEAKLPGGNGVAFDWHLLAGRRWSTPWMLAGGLTPENVGEAIRLTGARQVDVSSGVESAPGLKDGERIRAFCSAAMEP